MMTIAAGASEGSTPPSVILLSYHFFPSTEIGGRRATELAKFLARSGIRVLVVSSFGAKVTTIGEEIFPGVIAIPVPESKRRFLKLLVALKSRLVRRPSAEHAEAAGPSRARPQSAAVAGRMRTAFFRFLYFVDGSKGWSLAAARAARRAALQSDAVLLMATAPPPSVLLAGAWVTRRLGIPFVADLRDPWSDQLASDHPERTSELWLVRKLERWVLRQATAVTSTGADVLSLLAARDPAISGKCRLIRNGFDAEVQPPKFRTDHRLDLLFAGELYVGRDPFPLLAAIESLLEKDESAAARISITFMGRASSYKGMGLADWARGQRCEAVLRLVPPQPPAAVAKATDAATLLVNLAQGQHLSVPAKTFEQLAGGREVLILCEDGCETARIVAGIPGVIQVDPADKGRLATYIADVYRRHVLDGVATAPRVEDVQRFSRNFANTQFLELFGTLSSGVRRHSAGRPTGA